MFVLGVAGGGSAGFDLTVLEVLDEMQVFQTVGNLGSNPGDHGLVD